MRHSLPFILTLLFGSSSSTAQTANLWPDSNATWTVHHVTPANLLIWVSPTQLNLINGFNYTDITYSLGGDTVLGGQSYRVLEHEWDGYFQSLPSAPVDTMIDHAPQVGGFRGGFRKSGEQVYFWDSTDPGDHLLYDFDLQLGDTLPFSHINQNSIHPVVSLVDTVLLAGQAHRRFHLTGVGIAGTIMIEGVGSNHGPIQHIGIGFDITNSLICFGRNEMTLYPDTGDVCGPQWSGDPSTILESAPEGQATIYPNPMTARATVVLPQGQHATGYSLYNSAGSHCRAVTFDTARHTFDIDGNGMNAGLYHLLWWNGEGEYGQINLLVTR